MKTFLIAFALAASRTSTAHAAPETARPVCEETPAAQSRPVSPRPEFTQGLSLQAGRPGCNPRCPGCNDCAGLTAEKKLGG